MKSRDRGIVAIALFKVVKAILLVVVASGAFHFTNSESMESAEHWVSTISSAVGRRYVEALLTRLGGFTANRLELAGIAALVYAGLFAVEGVGLWMQKRWAEWLSVIATSSFVPLELYEIAKRASATRIIALVINAVAVLYLGVRLYRTRRVDTRAHR